MIFKWLSNLFNKFLRIFKEFMAIAFPIAKQIIIAQLKEFAVSTVSRLETTILTNEDKRKEAFNQISKEAKNRGIQIGTSLVYMLIEIALQYVKEKNNNA